jgi:hypothetical protein
MAFYPYITLDGNKYPTKFKNWGPRFDKHSTLRFTLNGSMDATYGPGELYSWVGEIKAHITPPGAGYGTPAQLRATLKKKGAIAMVDHYGDTYSVHVKNYLESSFTPDWTSPENAIFFNVKLEGVSA